MITIRFANTSESLNKYLPKFIKPKISFLASSFAVELMGQWEGIVFHIILRRVLYRGSHVLQISLKALFLRCNTNELN